MQLRLNQFLRRPHRLAIELVEKRARGAASDFALAVPDRNQRRCRDLRFLEVVITGDRYVDAGNPSSSGNAVHKANGNEIVPTTSRRRFVLECQELCCRLEATLLGARAGDAP